MQSTAYAQAGSVAGGRASRSQSELPSLTSGQRRRRVQEVPDPPDRPRARDGTLRTIPNRVIGALESNEPGGLSTKLTPVIRMGDGDKLVGALTLRLVEKIGHTELCDDGVGDVPWNGHNLAGRELRGDS